MRFQPGHSGNPAGRPAGSLNKKTLAARALLEQDAEEIVGSLKQRAKNGDRAAMRLCMDRLDPIGPNRPIAVELPVIKTPEDVEAALAVVNAELAAGNLTISEAAGLLNLIDRMVQIAERMWNFARQRRYDAAKDAIIFDEEMPKAASAAPKTPEKPDAPVYSPVNSTIAADAEWPGASLKRDGVTPQPGASGQKAASPMPRAA